MARGRGVYQPRGRGGSANGTATGPSGGGHAHPPGGDVKSIPPSTGYMPRGGSGHYTPRGRGTYQNVTRQLTGTSQSAVSGSAPMPVQTIKRGAPTGPPGPKRGRYESGPHSGQTRPIPLHHGSSQVSSHPPPHMSSYSSSSAPAPRYLHNHDKSTYSNLLNIQFCLAILKIITVAILNQFHP